MSHKLGKESYRYNSKGQDLTLYVQKYSSTRRFKRSLSIVILHDFGEHSGRYEEFIEKLCDIFSSAKVKLTCYAVDLPGHGKSTGRRGHISSFEKLTVDLVDFLNDEELENSVILGNSLGALVAINILHSYSDQLRGSISGAVLINPAFKLKWSIPDFLRSNILASNNIIKRLRLPFLVNGNDIVGTSDHAEVFDADPLNCHSPTVATYLEIEKLGKKLRTSSYYLSTPVFMPLSDSDSLYDHDLSEIYSHGLEQGRVKKYFRTPHDLITNQVANDMIKDIVKWYESLNGASEA